MSMAPHQQRVVYEKTELDEKLVKLRAFINSDLFLSIDKVEQSRLRHQRAVMEDYSAILGQRIGAFA